MKNIQLIYQHVKYILIKSLAPFGYYYIFVYATLYDEYLAAFCRIDIFLVITIAVIITNIRNTMFLARKLLCSNREPGISRNIRFL